MIKSVDMIKSVAGFSRGSPCMKRARLAATTLLRRSIASVGLEESGMISTFGSSWNGRYEMVRFGSAAVGVATTTRVRRRAHPRRQSASATLNQQHPGFIRQKWTSVDASAHAMTTVSHSGSMQLSSATAIPNRPPSKVGGKFAYCNKYASKFSSVAFGPNDSFRVAATNARASSPS